MVYLSLILIGFSAYFFQIEAVKVTVEQGDLEGQLLNAVVGGNQYNSFTGIPYAAPPVGTLRFKAPQPPQPWDGVRNATEHGPICIQFSGVTQMLKGVEDCLYLNVYTPNIHPETPLPVMFFIFGGGFFEGSGNMEEYGPDHLVRRDVVVVTFQYRLGALGFLALDTKDVPGNAGLKDQVAALKWVQKNIANFGGNPDEITIFGESSGAVSVAYHLVSPMSKGLFKRGILMSGVPSCDWVQEFLPQKRSFALGKLLGNNTEDPNVLLEFLQSVPAESIPPTVPRLLIAETLMINPIKMVNAVPVVEKDFGQERFIVEAFNTSLTRHPIKIDIMVGYNNEESVLAVPVSINQTFIDNYMTYEELYVPRKILMKRPPKEILQISNMIEEHFFQNKNNVTIREFVTYASETFVTYDIQRFVQIAAENFDSKIFFYRFSCFSDRNIYGKSGLPFGIQGAAHKDELAYLFEPVTANLTTSENSTEFELIERITTIFSNFAKHGHPTPDNNNLGVTWSEYNNVDEGYLEIGNELSVGKALGADMLAFWKSIYEYSGVDF